MEIRSRPDLSTTSVHRRETSTNKHGNLLEQSSRITIRECNMSRYFYLSPQTKKLAKCVAEVN